MKTKRVAILTGGGDVPGLNMCIKSLVYRVIDLGFEPIGVRKGWQGLINYNPNDPATYSANFLELTKNMVRPIDRAPGSFLHSSRIDPKNVPFDLIPEFISSKKGISNDVSNHIKNVVERLDYRALIVIGDDDMLSYAAHLALQGVPIIAIPKTIHNNIYGTDYTLGFSTGLARGVAFIHELRALAGSREQIIVVETFREFSGYSALVMSFLAGADRVIIPEVPYDPEKLAYLILQDKRQIPSNYAVLVVGDGAHIDEKSMEKYKDQIEAWIGTDACLNGNSLGKNTKSRKVIGSGIVAAELLSHITGEEVVTQPLTYLLRTGSPDGQDLLGASNFAFIAARLLSEGKYGRMAAFTQEKMWTDIDIKYALEGNKKVDIDNWYRSDTYQPDISIIWSIQ
jgi:ATP-dependent phosphofructokinase / diphosphate-dependent phosphofructokinase